MDGGESRNEVDDGFYLNTLVVLPTINKVAYIWSRFYLLIPALHLIHHTGFGSARVDIVHQNY